MARHGHRGSTPHTRRAGVGALFRRPVRASTYSPSCPGVTPGEAHRPREKADLATTSLGAKDTARQLCDRYDSIRCEQCRRDRILAFRPFDSPDSRSPAHLCQHTCAWNSRPRWVSHSCATALPPYRPHDVVSRTLHSRKPPRRRSRCRCRKFDLTRPGSTRDERDRSFNRIRVLTPDRGHSVISVLPLARG